MRQERPGHTLQTTALVDEAYLRLVDQRRVHWHNRAHFFGVAAQLMRRILIDYARKQRYAKRGGGAMKVSLDEGAVLSEERAADLVALDDALASLASIDPQQETAEVLKLSPDMVKREWSIARAWLYREIRQSHPDEA